MKAEASKVSIRQLEIFAAVMERRSYVEAAGSLGLTASAVSMQMSNLSGLLGKRLFVKSGRNIAPSLEATRFLPYAQSILRSLEEGLHVVRVETEVSPKTVRVGVVTTSRNFAPQLLQKFRTIRSDIDVAFEIADREPIIDHLRNGTVDFALMGRPPRNIDVYSFPFADHPYVIVASPDHPLSRAEQIGQEEMLQYPFISREKRSGTRRVLNQFFADKRFALIIKQEMTSNANIKQAVMANQGLALLSAHTIELERRASKLVVLNVKGMPIVKHWHLVHHKKNTLSAEASTFIKFVRENGRDFVTSFFEQGV